MNGHFQRKDEYFIQFKNGNVWVDYFEVGEGWGRVLPGFPSSMGALDYFKQRIEGKEKGEFQLIKRRTEVIDYFLINL